MPRMSPLTNRLLAALPREAQDRFFRRLERIKLPLGLVLYEPGRTLRFAYFPLDSIVSLLYRMENGSSGEIAVVGNEGVVGISLFMGGESTSSHAVVQSAGSAYRVPARWLIAEFQRHEEMMVLLLRYTQSLITQMTQTAACNRHHSIDEQMARWLLLSLDRLTGDRMAMTQRLVGNMLSATQPRVTEVARKLEKLGVIRYRAGRFHVLDRRLLEKVACECYSVVRHETDRLLPGASGKAQQVGHRRKRTTVRVRA